MPRCQLPVALPVLQARSQLVRRLVLPTGVLPAGAGYQVLCDLPFASGEPTAPGGGSYKLLLSPLRAGATSHLHCGQFRCPCRGALALAGRGCA